MGARIVLMKSIVNSNNSQLHLLKLPEPTTHCEPFEKAFQFVMFEAQRKIVKPVRQLHASRQNVIQSGWERVYLLYRSLVGSADNSAVILVIHSEILRRDRWHRPGASLFVLILHAVNQFFFSADTNFLLRIKG